MDVKEGTVLQVPVFVQPLTGELDGNTLILWAATGALPVVEPGRPGVSAEPLYLVMMVASRVSAVMRHTSSADCDTNYKENLTMLLYQGWVCDGEPYTVHVDWQVTVDTTEHYLRGWAHQVLMPLLGAG